MKWCEKHGITVDGLELREHPDGFGFGIFATKELRPDDVAMIIPNNSMITYQNSKAEFEGLIPPSMNGGWKVPIALKVLKERLSPSTEWGPAVEILPRDFSYHPLSFEPEDLALLEGSPAYFPVIFQYVGIVKNYVEIFRYAKENDAWHFDKVLKISSLTFEAFQWAWLVVTTRAMAISTDDFALLPFWDMMSHAKINFNFDTIKTNDSFVEIVQRKMNPGDEVLHSYIPMCNTGNFFAVWGISCPDEEFCPLLARTERKFENLRKLLKDVLPYPGQYLTVKSDNVPLGGEDLPFLLMNYGPTNFGQWPRTNLTSSIWNRAWNKFCQLIKNRLAEYPKTLLENQNLLAQNATNNTELSQGAKTCLQQVTKEQKILTNAIESATKLLLWTEDDVMKFGQKLIDENPKLKNDFPSLNSVLKSF